MLPLQCATLSASPRVVRISERVLQGTYSDPLSFTALGFGTAPTGDDTDVAADAWVEHFAGTLQMLADGFGWQLDSIRAKQDLWMADTDYEFEAGKIASGTVAAVRLRFDGIVTGKARLQLSWVYSMPDDPGDPWEPARPASSCARRFTRIQIDGDPRVDLTLELTGGHLPGADATATRAVNAVAAVCHAPVGVHSAIDLVVSPSGVSIPATSHQGATL